MPARVVHFEILADNPQAAVDFYKKVFGWDVMVPQGMEQYWLATTGPNGTPGINGGIMGNHFPQKTINTIEVESLEKTLEQVIAAGGKKVHGPNQIPGVGTHTYCTDPGGNMFGILEPPQHPH